MKVYLVKRLYRDSSGEHVAVEGAFHTRKDAQRRVALNLGYRQAWLELHPGGEMYWWDVEAVEVHGDTAEANE